MFTESSSVITTSCSQLKHRNRPSGAHAFPWVKKLAVRVLTQDRILVAKAAVHCVYKFFLCFLFSLMRFRLWVD